MEQKQSSILRLLLAAALLPLVAACNNTLPKTGSATGTTQVPTNIPVIEARNYVRVTGNRQQDSAIVLLIIDGSKVSGKMKYLPAEKDARTGTLSGTIENNIIHAKWSFMQEGMNDTVPVSFKLEDDLLLQKVSAYDVKTGKEYLPDTAQYTIEYKRER